VRCKSLPVLAEYEKYGPHSFEAEEDLLLHFVSAAPDADALVHVVHPCSIAPCLHSRLALLIGGLSKTATGTMAKVYFDIVLHYDY